jgi:predicted metal-dependent hydrolase
MAHNSEHSREPVPPELNEAIRSFNRGDYFAASEQFETVGNEAAEPLKDVVGALHRVAAGLHLRFARGGRQSTINLLSQAMMALDEMRPTRAGIDLERLYNEVAAFTDDVRASPREHEAGALKHRARLFLERRRAPRIILLG